MKSLTKAIADNEKLIEDYEIDCKVYEKQFKASTRAM